MATDRPRYTVSVTDEMLLKIDEFRLSHNYSTRSKATYELIRLGLEALKEQQYTDTIIVEASSTPQKRLIKIIF